jgi:hypothetical protein
VKDWSEMFPEGRDIFYEGDHPAAFAEQMRHEFGFDPSTDPGWSQWVPDVGYLCRFHCPPEHLDEVYGSGRWELGS